MAVGRPPKAVCPICRVYFGLPLFVAAICSRLFRTFPAVFKAAWLRAESRNLELDPHQHERKRWNGCEMSHFFFRAVPVAYTSSP